MHWLIQLLKGLFPKRKKPVLTEESIKKLQEVDMEAIRRGEPPPPGVKVVKIDWKK